jgi:radical SAM superfamily enzyme YgiQ (UPF0313 family)
MIARIAGLIIMTIGLWVSLAVIVEAWSLYRSPEGIEGVWFKDTDGSVIKNAARKEPKDLSWQIWPDRSRTRYRDYWVPGAKQPMVTTAVTSRGCPHSCRRKCSS